MEQPLAHRSQKFLVLPKIRTDQAIRCAQDFACTQMSASGSKSEL
jgi:hypothetical protein